MTIELVKLAELAGAVVHDAGQRAAADVSISEIGLDSANLPEGGLFAALPGTRSHGAKFAASTQAAAVLTDAAGVSILKEQGVDLPVLEVEDVRAVLGKVSAAVYGDPSQGLTVVGITGTSGKTTTSYLLEKGLLAAGKKVGLIGTTGTRIQGRAVATKLTTPEAPMLQQLFARMRDEGVTHVVMEVSSHALSLGRVSGTHFALAGFTNLSQDHLDFHPTMEEYFAAKAMLFDPESSVHADSAVVMVNDDWGQQMLKVAGENAKSVRTVDAASSKASKASETSQPPETPEPSGPTKPDFYTHSLRTLAGGGQQFQLTAGLNTWQVSIQLPGEFNVANAALASAIASLLPGVDMERFIEGLGQAQVPGRMERIDAGQDFLAVVDYAHKPAAVAAVLDAVRAQVKGRIAVVVGAGGDRDTSKRPIMGAEAAKRAELVVVTDDNPRSEDPATIRQAVLAGATEVRDNAESTRTVTVEEIGDRAAAIAHAINWAEPGDAVVVAGKGHEVGQQVGTEVHHFDDREEVLKALEARSAANSETPEKDA